MTKFKFQKTDDNTTILENAKKGVSMCQELNPGSGMRFFITPGLDIKGMPSDARVEYIYMPTYTLAAYLIQCKLHLGDLFTNDPELEDGFKAILLACTGRGMTGHGYDAEYGLVDALEIFLEAPIKAFLAKHGKEYPEFTRCFKKAVKALQDLAEGKPASPWGEDPKLTKRAKDLFSVWESAK